MLKGNPPSNLAPSVASLRIARQHLEAAQGSVERFAQQGPYGVFFDHDHITGEEVLRVHRRPGTSIEPPDEMVFQIGDALHNMRVALDYLAFRVVRRQNRSANVRRILFPIYSNARKWRELSPKHVPGVDPTTLAIFRRLQPYQRGNGAKDNPLRLLDELENVHKHRHLLDANFAVIETIWPPDARYMVTRARYMNSVVARLKEGAEVARIHILDRSLAVSEINVRVRFYVCFHVAGPARKRVVLRLLKRVHDHIRDVVFPAFESLV